jgi:hypothetical protein
MIGTLLTITANGGYYILANAGKFENFAMRAMRSKKRRIIILLSASL